MKRTTAVLIFFFACACVHGQTLRFQDKTTGEAIEGVFVKQRFPDKQQAKTYVTNAQGEVQLLATTSSSILLARHVSYQLLLDTLPATGIPEIYELVPLSRELKEVVVTGQFEPQSAEQSVYQLKVIDRERIRAQGATQLQDVLMNELNIRFSQDLALGSANVSMQGLSGQNIKILLDGMPITGRQGTSNEVNINHIDINSVERIELVEGPLSVVYGGDALAGVINIITKKPDQDKLSVQARLHEETVGGEYGSKEGIHHQYAGLAWQRKRWELAGNLGRNYFGGWQGAAEGREKEWHPKTQWTGNALAGYQTDRLHLWYRLDMLNETITNPGAFSGREALDKDFMTERFMHQLQAEAKPGEHLRIQSGLSYTDYERKTLSTTVNKENGDRRLALGEGLQDVTSFQGTAFRTTLSYAFSPAIAVQPGVELNHESGTGGRIKEGVQELTDYAFFLSAELKPFSWMSLRPGFRLIHNSGYEAPPWVPSLSSKLELSRRLDLRIAYGRGFRGPSLRELYFNFFDSNHAIEGNPELEAEFSHSYNASLNWQAIKREAFSLGTVIGGFYNDIDNLIGNGYKESSERITTYVNVGQYQTTGFSLNNTLHWQQLEATAAFSYIGRYNEFAEEDATLPVFNWSAEANANVRYHIRPLKTAINLYYKYTGPTPYYEVGDSEEQIHLAETGGYHWADLSLQRSFGKWVSLNGGIRNLLNVVRIEDTSLASGAHNAAGPKPIGYGRSYFLSLIVQWQQP